MEIPNCPSNPIKSKELHNNNFSNQPIIEEDLEIKEHLHRFQELILKQDEINTTEKSIFRLFKLDLKYWGNIFNFILNTRKNECKYESNKPASKSLSPTELSNESPPNQASSDQDPKSIQNLTVINKNLISWSILRLLKYFPFNMTSDQQLSEFPSHWPILESELCILKRMLQIASATIIQKHFRGFSQRKKFEPLLDNFRQENRRIQAAITIQKHFRGNKGREAYEFEKSVVLLLNERQRASIVIQKYWRGWLARKEFEIELTVSYIMRTRSLAAKDIQRVWKGFKTRQAIDSEWTDWVIKWSWNLPGSIVEVVGEFSNPSWTKRYLMTYCHIRKCFILKLPRKVGRYELKFIVDGRYVCDGLEPIVLDGAGHYNNLVTVNEPIRPPLERIRAALKMHALQYKQANETYSYSDSFDREYSIKNDTTISNFDMDNEPNFKFEEELPTKLLELNHHSPPFNNIELSTPRIHNTVDLSTYNSNGNITSLHFQNHEISHTSKSIKNPQLQKIEPFKEHMSDHSQFANSSGKFFTPSTCTSEANSPIQTLAQNNSDSPYILPNTEGSYNSNFPILCNGTPFHDFHNEINLPFKPQPTPLNSLDLNDNENKQIIPESYEVTCLDGHPFHNSHTFCENQLSNDNILLESFSQLENHEVSNINQEKIQNNYILGLTNNIYSTEAIPKEIVSLSNTTDKLNHGDNKDWKKRKKLK